MVNRDLSLAFGCPVCGAAPHERCHAEIGVICLQSHLERWRLADDAVFERLAEVKKIARSGIGNSFRGWQPLNPGVHFPRACSPQESGVHDEGTARRRSAGSPNPALVQCDSYDYE